MALHYDLYASRCVVTRYNNTHNNNDDTNNNNNHIYAPVRVAVRGVPDGALAQLNGLIDRHVVLALL
jgi:hypothetical protein